MNLYAITFVHYAQRGSQEGIYTYLVAKDSEDVYDWFNLERPTSGGYLIYSHHKDYENDGKTYSLYDSNYNIIGEESHRDKMIRLQGELYDEDLELSDLYYGKTVLGWHIISAGISKEDVIAARRIGVSIDVTDTYKYILE